MVDVVYQEAIEPYTAKEIGESETIKLAYPPLHAFMIQQTKGGDFGLFWEFIRH